MSFGDQDHFEIGRAFALRMILRTSLAGSSSSFEIERPAPISSSVAAFGWLKNARLSEKPRSPQGLAQS